MPKYSVADQSHITSLMQSGSLFPAVTQSEDRNSILNKLLQIPGRILTLHTLSQDWIYMGPPSRALRGLLPKNFKGSIRSAMLKRFVKGERADGGLRVQTSAHEYRELVPYQKSTPQIAGLVSLIVLWLCSMRHFVVPRKDSRMPEQAIEGLAQLRGLPKLAAVAREVGFSSKEINQLCLQDIDSNTCQRFL